MAGPGEGKRLGAPWHKVQVFLSQFQSFCTCFCIALALEPMFGAQEGTGRWHQGQRRVHPGAPAKSQATSDGGVMRVLS